MSRLSIFPDQATDTGQTAAPLVVSDDAALIHQELMQRGIGFEQWAAPIDLAGDADEASILRAYADDVAQVVSQRSRVERQRVDPFAEFLQSVYLVRVLLLAHAQCDPARRDSLGSIFYELVPRQHCLGELGDLHNHDPGYNDVLRGGWWCSVFSAASICLSRLPCMMA